jgi:hypothetical protein
MILKILCFSLIFFWHHLLYQFFQNKALGFNYFEFQDLNWSKVYLLIKFWQTRSKFGHLQNQLCCLLNDRSDQKYKIYK